MLKNIFPAYYLLIYLYIKFIYKVFEKSSLAYVKFKILTFWFFLMFWALPMTLRMFLLKRILQKLKIHILNCILCRMNLFFLIYPTIADFEFLIIFDKIRFLQNRRFLILILIPHLPHQVIPPLNISGMHQNIRKFGSWYFSWKTLLGRKMALWRRIRAIQWG